MYTGGLNSLKVVVAQLTNKTEIIMSTYKFCGGKCPQFTSSSVAYYTYSCTHKYKQQYIIIKHNNRFNNDHNEEDNMYSYGQNLQTHDLIHYYKYKCL